MQSGRGEFTPKITQDWNKSSRLVWGEKNPQLEGMKASLAGSLAWKHNDAEDAGGIDSRPNWAGRRGELTMKFHVIGFQPSNTLLKQEGLQLAEASSRDN